MNSVPVGSLLCWWRKYLSRHRESTQNLETTVWVLHHHSPCFFQDLSNLLKVISLLFCFSNFLVPLSPFYFLSRNIVNYPFFLFIWEFLITGVILKALIIYSELLNKKVRMYYVWFVGFVGVFSISKVTSEHSQSWWKAGKYTHHIF